MRSSRRKQIKKTIDSKPKSIQNNSVLPKKLNKAVNCQTQTNKMAEPKFTLESLVNILPTFEGKKTENIENYLMLFEQLIQEVELTENLKILILKSKLNGIARDFISQDDDLAKITNYEDFKTKLKKLFKHSKTLESIQDDFMNLSQKPTQTIAEYSRIFDLAARKYLNKCGCQDQPGAIEFLNSLKLTKFLSSIKPDISLEVRKMGPKTFEDARSISLKIESAFNSIPSEAINANKTNDSDLCKMLMEMTMTQNNKIKDLENKIEQKFNSDIPRHNTNNIIANVLCDICLKGSHATKFCWYNAIGPNFRQPRNTQNYVNQKSYPQKSNNYGNNNRYKSNYNNRNTYRKNNNTNNRNNNQNKNNATPNVPMITLPEN